jgi:hypothetical protein
MTNQHPVTPPPELVQQWAHLPADWNTVASLIAQWGADQELEACCEWLIRGWDSVRADKLHAARRPKPPSLKEQALAAVAELEGFKGVDTIRRALEALPE